MTANIRLWILNRFDTNTDNATDVSWVVSSFVTISPMPKQRLLRHPWMAGPVLGLTALCRFSGSKTGSLSSGIFCLPVSVRDILPSAPDTVLPLQQDFPLHYKGQKILSRSSHNLRCRCWHLSSGRIPLAHGLSPWQWDGFLSGAYPLLKKSSRYPMSLRT